MIRLFRRYSKHLLAAALLGQGTLGLSQTTAQEPQPVLRVRAIPHAVVDMAQPIQVPLPATPAPADAAHPPAATVAPDAPIEGEPCCNERDWTKIPPLTPMPRAGWFIIPYDGPGYYSGLDWLKRNCLEKAPKNPYPPISICADSFFNNDYRFLDDPNNTQHDWSDFYHRMHIGDDWLLSFGGEFRYRYMSEENSRLSGFNNGYNLLRYRAYGDVWYGDRLRVYIEFLSANSFGQRLAPLAIDRNLAEIQNLFVDLKFANIEGNGAYLRVGRQELLYGSQRLISPLDWANTRRTFQGAKAFWHSDRWDFDVFWVRPLIVDPFRLDSWNDRQNFTGGWATYKPKKGTSIDFYALNLSQFFPVLTGVGGVTGAQSVYTLGTRAAGDFDGRFLYDGEAMYQMGNRVNQYISAGATTAGLGYRAKEIRWNPTVWGYYDWASGNGTPGRPGTVFSTFNQLFPFGHYYFGFLDDVGRQNIHDVNAQVSLNPQPWIVLLAQYHHFFIDSPRDFLFSAGGVGLRRSPAGTAGRIVGDEMDFLANVHLTKHQDILVGYSRLFTGDFVRNTAPNPNAALPAGLFYGQYSYKF